MQISNPTLYQFIGNSLDRNQLKDRSPVKPVTIEGQIVDEDEQKNRARPTESSSDFVQSLESGSQQLIPPVTVSPELSDSLLIEKNLNADREILSQFERITSRETFSGEQSFPFGNRKSLNGLAGGSLVSQNYLSNEPLAPDQSENSSRRIDIFI